MTLKYPKATRLLSAGLCLSAMLIALTASPSRSSDSPSPHKQIATGRVIHIADLEGIDLTGQHDNAPIIQRALKSSGQALQFPCGVFLLAATILLPSNTTVLGNGTCTVLKTSSTIEGNPNWRYLNIIFPPGYPAGVFANSDWQQGTSNIVVRDVVLDGSNGTNGGRRLYLVAFYKTDSISIERVRFIGSKSNDVQVGAAIISASKFSLIDNFAEGMRSACYGIWDGSHDFIIAGNECDGRSISSGGITVNGLSTSNESNTSYNGVIANNMVRNTKDTGVFVGGLWNGSKEAPVYGDVRSVTIENNQIENVSTFHGVLVSDARDVSVTGNTVRGIGREGIRVGSQFRGITSGIVLRNNSVEDSNRSPEEDDAIRITNGASNVTMAGNTVSAGRHRCAIAIDPDVSHTNMPPSIAGLTPGSASAACDRRTDIGHLPRSNGDH